MVRSHRRPILILLSAIAAAWLAAKFLLPLISPFLLGTVLALSAEPMVGFLNRKAHIPRPAAAAVGVSMAFSFLALLLLTLCAFALRQLKALAGALPDLESAARSGLALAQSRLLALASRTPGNIQPLLKDNIRALLSDSGALLGKLTAWLLGLAGAILSRIPDSALGLGTAVLSAFFISAKLPQLRQRIRSRIPKARLLTLMEALQRMRRVLGKWLLAEGKLMGVTFCIVGAGLMLLRISHSLLWALLTAMVDALPILGTGTVLVPWSIVCFLQDDTPRALGILGIYLTAALTRSLLEPRLLGRHLGLDPLVTLMALYIGCRLWGVGGILLAPMLTAAALQLFRDDASAD